MRQCLNECWQSVLDERDAYVLQERLTTTLAEIGSSMNISRERVRQLEDRARMKLRGRLRAVYGDELSILVTALESELAVDDVYLTSLFGEAERSIWLVSMNAIGIVPVSAWGRDVDSWWTARPDAARAAVLDLVAQAPFRYEELLSRSIGVALPRDFPLRELFESSGSPVRRHPLGSWLVRRSAVQRDAAYLWLLDRGEPAPIAVIASAIGQAENAAREGMRRDDRFVLLRPIGHWCLAEWSLPNAGFKSALGAVVSLLSDRGPMPYEIC